MDPPPVTIPSLRLVDVAASDVSRHLAAPVTYAPDQDGNAYAELASKDMPLSHDRGTVQQVVQLLSNADLSYLYAPLLHTTPDLRDSKPRTSVSARDAHASFMLCRPQKNAEHAAVLWLACWAAAHQNPADVAKPIHVGRR